MTKKTPIAVAVVAAAAAAAVVGFAVPQGTAGTGIRTLADVASACAAAQDSSGFGSVTLTQSLNATNETVTIAVPCTIHLVNGAGLAIQNSRLTTDKLIVADDGADPTSSRVMLEHTTLTGVPGSGLLVQLRHASDSIGVHASTIDYPLSVYLLALNHDGSGQAGTIKAEADTITSNDPASEGIHLVSDGVGHFEHLTLSTDAKADGGLALLYAPTCSEEGVTGAPQAC